jgi:uncharacterized membrane protein YhaH (DUF805 family)
MIDSVRSSLNNYADFKARATRKEFWTFLAFFYAASIVGGFIDGLLGVSFVAPIAALGLYVPMLACSARRMHDVNKPGWYFIIPFYGFILLFTPTQPEFNSPVVD